MRKVIKQLLTTAIFFSLFFLPKEGRAQKPCCWIDVKTGKSVPTVPLSGSNLGDNPLAGTAQMEGFDPKADHAFNSKTGQNFYRQPDGCWIDTKTGKSVPTVPLSGRNLGDNPLAGAAQMEGFDPKADHAFNSKTGQNFVRVPCPPPTAATKKDTTAKTANKDFPHKDIFVGFSFIHEDNGSNGFYTYGGQVAYTRNLCRRGGLTGDLGVNFGNNGGVDYTKFNILAGGTYYPVKTAVPASDFSFSIHALAGINSIRSSYSGMSNSNSSFTLDVGPGFNYYFVNKLGLGLRAGYMPSFGKGNTSNNFRVALGLDIR